MHTPKGLIFSYKMDEIIQIFYINFRYNPETT